MAVPSATFRTLHRIHRQLTDLRSRLERGPKLIAARNANLNRLEESVASAKEDVKKSQLAANQKELQLKEREGQILNTQAKLNAASSNKEYQAFVEQIAADNQANSVLSDEILELFDKVEELQGIVSTRESELAQSTQELGEITKKIEGERASLETDLQRLTNECGELQATLPAEIKPDFERVVGTRGEDGLAQIEEEFCGNCNQQVNAQMINELLMERVVPCKSCGAYLYLPENREPVKGGE